jgi:hypothetical protein
MPTRFVTYAGTAVAGAALAVAIIGWTSHAGATREGGTRTTIAAQVGPTSTMPRPSIAPGPTPTRPTSPPTASMGAAIDAMLLRPEEVAAPYWKSPRFFSDASYPFYDTACGDLPSPTIKRQVTFQQGVFGPFIYNSVGVYDDVAALFERYAEAARTCSTEAGDRADEVPIFTETSFPRIGDRTFAASFTGDVAGFSYAGTVVLVSKGNLASVVVAVGAPKADTARLETYVRDVERRMR